MIKDNTMILQEGTNIANGGKYTALILSTLDRKLNQEKINQQMEDDNVDTIMYAQVSKDILNFLSSYIDGLIEMINEKDSLLNEYMNEENI